MSRKVQEPAYLVLDRLSTPVLLVDADGRVVFCNKAARRLVGHGDGVRVRSDHRIGFTDAGAKRQYDQLFVGSVPRAGVIKINRPSRKPPYLVRIAPFESDAGAIVFINDPSATFALDRELLTAAFALTDAELRLTEALFRGDTLTEFSAASGVQPSTARTQLLSVFKKTGTSRQALLVKLLMSLRARE